MLYDDEETSDFDLVVGGGEDSSDNESPSHIYHLHSIIVARHSPVLMHKIESLFEEERRKDDASSCQKPRLSLSKDLKNIPAKYFKPILKYMYTGNMRCPSPGEELQFYLVAKELGVEGLCKALLAYMGTYFTVTDACLILEKVLSQGHHKLFEICTYLVELHAEVIFTDRLARDLFLKWNIKTMQHFVICGKMNVVESDIFEAVKQYCMFNAERFNSTPKQLFEQHFDEYVRYALIDADTLCSKVLPLGWVKRQHIAEAFKYHSVNGDNKSILEKQIPRCVPRETRGAHKYVFDEKNSGTGLIVTNHGLTVESNVSSSFRSIATNKPWTTPGTYFIEFLLDHSTDPSNIFFGVCNPSNMLKAGYASQNADSWQLYSYNGNLYNRSTSHTYTAKPAIGDRIGVYLDATDKNKCKLYFFKNGESLGLASSDISLPQVPCVSLYAQKDEVSIVKRSRKPSRPTK